MLGLAVLADYRRFPKHRDPPAVNLFERALGKEPSENFAFLHELAKVIVMTIVEGITNHRDDCDSTKRLGDGPAAFD